MNPNENFTRLFENQEAAKQLSQEKEQCLNTTQELTLKLKEEMIDEARNYLIEKQAIVNQLRNLTSHDLENTKIDQEAIQVLIVARLLIAKYQTNINGETGDFSGGIAFNNVRSLLKNSAQITEGLLPLFNRFTVRTGGSKLIQRKIKGANLKKTSGRIANGEKILIDFVNHPTTYLANITNKDGETKKHVFLRVRNIGRKNVASEGIYISAAFLESSITNEKYDQLIRKSCGQIQKQIPTPNITIPKNQKTPKQSSQNETSSPEIKRNNPLEAELGEHTPKTPPKPQVATPTRKAPPTPAQPYDTTEAYRRETEHNLTPEVKKAIQETEKDIKQLDELASVELDDLNLDYIKDQNLFIEKLNKFPEESESEIVESILGKGLSSRESDEYILAVYNLIQSRKPTNHDKLTSIILIDLLEKNPILIFKNPKLFKSITENTWTGMRFQEKIQDAYQDEDKETRHQIAKLISESKLNISAPTKVEYIYPLLQLEDYSKQEIVAWQKRAKITNSLQQSQILILAQVSEGAGVMGHSYETEGSREPSAFILNSKFYTLLNANTRKIFYQNYSKQMDRYEKAGLPTVLDYFKSNDQVQEYMYMLDYYLTQNPKEKDRTLRKLLTINTKAGFLKPSKIQKAIQTKYPEYNFTKDE